MAVVLVGFVAVNLLFLVAMFGAPVRRRDLVADELWPALAPVALRELAALPDGELVRVRGRVRAVRGLADKPGVVAWRGQVEDWVSERVVPFSVAIDEVRSVEVDVRRARLVPAPSGRRNWKLASDDEVELVAVVTTQRDELEQLSGVDGGPFRSPPSAPRERRVVLAAGDGAPVLVRPAG